MFRLFPKASDGLALRLPFGVAGGDASLDQSTSRIPLRGSVGRLEAGRPFLALAGYCPADTLSYTDLIDGRRPELECGPKKPRTHWRYSP